MDGHPQIQQLTPESALAVGATVAITLTDTDGTPWTDRAEIIECLYRVRWLDGSDSHWAVGTEDLVPATTLLRSATW